MSCSSLALTRRITLRPAQTAFGHLDDFGFLISVGTPTVAPRRFVWNPTVSFGACRAERMSGQMPHRAPLARHATRIAQCLKVTELLWALTTLNRPGF